MEQVGVQFIAQDGGAFLSTMDDATKATNTFVDATEKGGGKISGAGEIMTGALRQIGAVAVDMLGKAAQATGAFLKDSVDKAGDFQAGMLEFQAVAGKGVDTAGLEQFHDLFLRLGKDLPVSTADVQQAAIELVKGGIDPATIAAGGLQQSIQFAAAAMGGDLAGAAEISAKVVGGWADVTATAQEKADLLTHSTDLLTKAANASTVDVQDLALGLYNVQGTAKTVGLSLDETTTALAELAPRFSNANTAGTSFRNFLVRLQPSTDPAKDAMAELGLWTKETGSVFYDTQGKFVGVAEASRILQATLGTLTDAQKTQALQQIFGNDAMNAAAAFAEMGAEGYDTMAASLENANGVLENATLKQGGFNVGLDNMQGSIESLQITLGEQLLPVLGTVMNDYIMPGINSITRFAEAVFKAHEETGSWTATIDQFLPGFQAVYDTAVEVAGFIKDNLTPILAAVGAVVLSQLVPAFVAWAFTAEGAVIPAAIATVTAMAPIILTAAAIGAAVALLVKGWQDDWLGIRTAVTDFWDKYGEPIFTDVQTWLSKNIPVAVQAASTFFTGTFLPAIKDIWSFIQTYVIPLFVALFRVEFAIAQKAGEALAGIWQNVLWPALQKVWSFIQTSVIPIFKEIGGYLSDTFGPTLTSLTGWLGDVTGGFGGISGAISGVIGWVNDLATAISNLDLPDWATPGSPTPAEIGFKGMAKALKTELNPQIGALAQNLTVMPIASPAQIAAQRTGMQTTYNQQRTLNMPIYTNMTPTAMQQSMAIVQATMA